MSNKVILPADEDGNPNSAEEAYFGFGFDTTASNTGSEGSNNQAAEDAWQAHPVTWLQAPHLRE